MIVLSTTSNYNTENAKAAHDFCAIVTFTGIADPQFASNTFGDITSAYKKLIKNITYESPEYEPGEPLLRRAKLSFTLVDKDEAIIDLIGGNILLNKEVTVKFGFVALDVADFVTLPTFFVRKITVSKDSIDHNFICEETSDFDQLYNDSAYKIIDETYLTADETAADATINVLSTAATGFIDPAAIPAGIESAAIIINNKEIVAYTGKTATTWTGCVRGHLGTTAQIHSQGAIVKPCYIFNESFPQVFMRILTSGAAGTNGRYDSGIANMGPREQFSSSLIDDEQMEREGWRFHAAYEPGGGAGNLLDEEFHYAIFKETPIKKIINDLFKPFHASLYKNVDGELSVRVMDLPAILEEVLSNTLDDNNNDLDSMEFLDDLMMTDAVYRHDWDWGANKFLRTENDSDINKNDESNTAYGGYPKKEIENKALDYLVANSLFFHSYERFVLFYGNMLTKLNVSPLFREWLFEPLDDIQADSSFWPNYRDSNRTWSNEVCTVMKKIVQFNSPNLYSVNYDLLNYLLIKKATSLFTLDVYDGDDGGFDSFRTNVQFSATNDVSLEAEDGHGSWAGDESGVNYIYVKLLVAIGPGADAEADIRVCVRGQKFDVVFTDELRNTTKIKYNSSWNRTITVWLPALGPRNDDPILRMKVDWFASNGQVPTSITIDKWYVLKETYFTP